MDSGQARSFITLNMAKKAKNKKCYSERLRRTFYLSNDRIHNIPHSRQTTEDDLQIKIIAIYSAIVYCTNKSKKFISHLKVQ
jgi:hypothetical protein